MRLYLFCTLLFTSTVFSACQIADSPTLEATPLPSRSELRQSLRSEGKVLFIYQAKDQALAEGYRSIIQKMEQSDRFRYAIEMKEAAQVDTADLHQKVLILMGAFDESPTLQPLFAQLPLTYTEQGVAFNKKHYADPAHVLKLSFYPNPLHPSLPLYLITGNSDQAIQDLMQDKYAREWADLFWRSWGYEVYQNGELLMLGNYADSTWVMDEKIHFEFDNQGDTLLQTPHFTFLSNEVELKEAELEAMGRQCEASATAICEYTGQQANGLRISCRMHASMEQKGLQYNNTDQAHIRWSKNEVHMIVNENFQGQLQQLENQVLIRHLLGKPKTAALEDGLALKFAPNWHWRGANYWAGRLYSSGNLPPLAEIFDDKLVRAESDFVFQPMAYLLVSFLEKEWGSATFLERYATWAPTEEEIAALTSKWQAFLAAQFADPSAFQVVQQRAPKSFLKGFNFAHEGYRIYNGYGSNLAKASLEKLARLGTNAIAVVPYSYMRNPKKPTYIPIINSPGAENDESVVFAHAEAQKLGMYTLLKPQIWISRSWPGDVEMQSEEEWAQFFNYYYRWIRHYAMLAELYQFDGLCLGVEFGKATLGHEEEWRKIAQLIKGLYGGQLTYAANWGAEFEQLTFWDEFDYIGLNCYYPLSKEDAPDKAALQQKFATIIDKINTVSAKYDRPVAFTEIGFRSVEAPWKNPHAEPQNRPMNDVHQALCYEVVFEGLSQIENCSGIFWWKWPSYLDYQSRRNKSFTPNRKLAEQTVQQYFKQ
ncbi:MAG: hypothetical protein AAF798_02900 [Bacteroidota bacterium]